MENKKPYELNPKQYCEESLFPNTDVDPAKKKKPSYGKAVGKAIHAAYIRNQGLGVYDRIRKNRLYASGKQDVDQYRAVLNPKVDEVGSRNWVSISHENSPVIPKFVDVIVGDMMNQDMKPQFNSIDPKSHVRKQNARDEFYGKLIRQQTSEAMESELGFSLEPKDPSIPQNEEEIEMHMELDYKEDIEIAMEEITDFELYHNDYKGIEKRIQRDMVENKKGAARIYFDETNHIRMEYIDLEYLTHSYTEDPSHMDCEYYGFLKRMTIRELRKISNGELSDEDLFEIARDASGGGSKWKWGLQFNDSRMYGNEEYQFDDFSVEVLDFTYYTTDRISYQYKENKYGGHFFDKKGYNWQPPTGENAKKKGLFKEVEMEYTGLYIPATKHLVKYGPSKSIVRERDNGKPRPECVRRFIIFEPNLRYGGNTSLVERITPNEDEIQNIVRKMRQFVAEAVPPGVAIDIDALVRVSETVKNIDSPFDIIKLFKQKGVLLYDRTDKNGDPTNGRPVDFLQNGLGDGLRPFMDAIAFQVQQIREITGINEARDATSPDAKALVGIQKLQLINSNNATRELYEGYLQGIYKRVCSITGNMIQDKAYLRGGLKEYESIIGRLGIKSIESMQKDISLAQLGVKVEVLPGESEIESLMADIAIEIQNGTIGVEDKQEILRIKNPKKGEQLLRYRKKKNREAAMQRKAQEEQMRAQTEQSIVMAAAEAEKMKNESRLNVELAIIEAKKNAEIEILQYKLPTETEGKLRLENVKGMNKIDEIEKAGEMNLDDTKGSKEVPDPRVFTGASNLE